MAVGKIVVIGSTNTDMVIKTSRLPLPGETILGGEFLMNPGGKGANQAVAAARLGGEVTLVARTGDDIFGRQTKELLQSEKLCTDFLFTDAHLPSGIALITVDEKAENCIVVAPGANAALGQKDIDMAAHAIQSAEIVLMQLEIPLQSVHHAAAIAHKAGKKILLNPAPAQPLDDTLLEMLFLITPNETEAELLTGVAVTDLAAAEKAARILLAKGVSTVVLTMGARGALLVTNDGRKLVPSFPADAMDTTAAGDCFNGALAVAISEGMALEEAISFANKAASISVTRMGAQASMPYRNEVFTE